jgi:hypothetical protein
MIKTLLSGCSISDWCGFGQPLERDNNTPIALIGNHADPRCWYNIIKNNFDLDLTNVSYGGFSNEEILSQVLKNLALVDDYELVIIQLTSTQRKWFYRSDNPFDFVLARGDNNQDATEKKLLEYFSVYFNNELVEIERTMTLLLLIQRYLNEKSIPLIVANGMNFGDYLKRIKNNAKFFCQPRIVSDIWQLKGVAYAYELQQIANKINLDNFVCLDQSFIQLQNDYADDQSHPGEQSNLLYASIIGEKILSISKK